MAMRFGRSARAFMTAVPRVLQFLLDGPAISLPLHPFGERFELVVRRPVGPRALTRSVTSRADRAHADDMSQGWAQQPQQVRGYSNLPPIPHPNAHTSRPSPSFDRCCSFSRPDDFLILPPSPSSHQGFGGPQQGGGEYYSPNAQPMPAYNQPMPGQDVHYRGHPAGTPSAGPMGGPGGGLDGFGIPGGLPISPKSLARVGLGAYGDKVLGAGQAYYAKYFGGGAARYYFDVTEAYAWNKLKLVACPFLHKGSWARIPEQVAGGLTFKPPRNDINAPDLYIPLMGFWSYVLAASTLQVRRGEFSPEGVAVHASWGLALWTAEAVFVWMALRSLSSSHNHVSAPMMDLAAYTGYMFVLVAAALATKILFLPYWGQILAGGWGALASAVFMVKTTKRIIFSEARSHGFDGNRHNYVLLVLAGLQFPLHFWLGSV